MRETNALVTRKDVEIMGLYKFAEPPANPAYDEQIVTKGWLQSYYYLDNTVAPFSSYTSNRCPRYQDLLGAAIGALPNFYQYDVTRSGIPGAEGAYFTYTDHLGNTNEIVQDAYGYVGRFCMEENSYMNNQWNVYSISLVGICYPSNQGTTYPYPPSPQYLNNNFEFTISPGYVVKDVSIFDSAGNPKFIQPGVYSNDKLLDSLIFTTGTHFIRYFIYDTSGNFITKVGFRGYPAKSVTFLETTYYEFLMWSTFEYSYRCSDTIEQGYFYSTDSSLMIGSKIYGDSNGTELLLPEGLFLYLRNPLDDVVARVNSNGYVESFEICNRGGGGFEQV